MRKNVFLYNDYSAEIKKFFCVFLKKSRILFTVYCISTVLARTHSIKRLSEDYFGSRVDSLHYFLKDSIWRTDKMKEVFKQVIRSCLFGSSEQILLVIDDTPIKRTGACIEGLGVHHSSDGYIKGQCVVTVVARLGAEVFGLFAQGYRPKCSCPRKEFKTKIDLALEALKFVEEIKILAPVTVLIDVWYACQRVLDAITKMNFRYVAAVKSNRLITVNGKKCSVRDLAKGRREYVEVIDRKGRRIKVAKIIVTLSKVGAVALFITKGGITRYLISNDLALTEKEAVHLYADRWTIETWHKAIKQNLGFGEMWIRNWQACQRHWTLALIIHNALVLWNRSRPPSQQSRTFGAIVRSFRNEINISPGTDISHFLCPDS